MHVRVLGADGAGGAAEELGQEAPVAAHAADDGAARRRAAPAGSGGAWRGRRLAAPHGAIDRDLRGRMRGASVGAACDRPAAGSRTQGRALDW